MELDLELILFNMDNKKSLDFNCDLAQCGSSDEDKSLELIDYVSSVNIACGLENGCPLSMMKAIEHCKFKSKVIGALIGLPENIKNPLELSEEEIEAIILYQLGAISAFAKAYSLNIEHVRPHGRMYDLALENPDFSIKIANAVKKFNKWFVLYGAMGDTLEKTAKETNITIASEFKIEDDASIEKLKEMIEQNNLPDTLHFSLNSENVSELLQKVSEIVSATPVNFNRAAASGWVE